MQEIKSKEKSYNEEEKEYRKEGIMKKRKK
jgi:hypothetical protein